MTQPEFDEMLDAAHIVREQAPPETTRAEYFFELLVEHLTNRMAAKRSRDLTRGLPWQDMEGELGEGGPTI